jgi:hypothetical protein
MSFRQVRDKVRKLQLTVKAEPTENSVLKGSQAAQVWARSQRRQLVRPDFGSSSPRR